MKPFSLHGHERAITQIKYNREGDLLFSCAKDHSPNVWYSLNGERLGTYNGHIGALWCVDVNWDTTRLMSGSADESCILWDVETGIEIGKINSASSVRTCNFSYSANMACYTTDRRKITVEEVQVIKDCEIFIIDVRNADNSIGDQNPILRLKLGVDKSKVTSMLWGPLDQSLITGHEDGTIVQWDLKMGKELSSQKCHDMQINDMQMSKDQVFFITASKDTTAKLFLTDPLSVLKTYKSGRPVNSAAISPILDHVVLGGGQEAMEVTTTSTRHGKFESRFYHLVFEEEFARVKGHFGPINSLAFHPDGKSYATGGEDGYIRVQTFDQNYYDFGFDY